MTSQTVEKIVCVTNQLDTMSSFALEEETGEQVFINARLCKNFDIAVGDVLKTFVVANNAGQPAVKWYAIFVKKIDSMRPGQMELDLGDTVVPPIPDGPRVDYEDRVLSFLHDGPGTTRQVADGISLPVTQARHVLERMFRAGMVCMAGVRRTPTQSKDSFAVWALDINEFRPEDNDD